MRRSGKWLALACGFFGGGTLLAIYDLPSAIELKDADTIYYGEEAGDTAGWSVASLGDINGDAISDFAVGAPEADASVGDSAGKVYIFFGHRTSNGAAWQGSTSIADADVVLSGEAAKDDCGMAVAGIGDVNYDGKNDLGVGAPTNAGNGSSSGKVYIVLGKSSGWQDQSVIDAAVSSYIGGQGESAGQVLSAAGDVNDDGIGDLVVGVNSYTYKPSSSESYTFAGKSYIIFGRTSGWQKNVTLTTGANASIHGEISSELVGRAVAGGRDLNGDGMDDVVIGAPGNTRLDDGTIASYRGRIGIFLGRYSGWALDMPFSSADYSYPGEIDNSEAGKSVVILDDITQDGYADILVGAPGFSPSSSMTKAGAIYLLMGRPRDEWPLDTDLSIADGSWIGENTNDAAGSSLSALGDFNVDGNRDFLVGAYSNDAEVVNGGRSYIVYGSKTFPTYANLGTSGITITGTEYDGQSGRSLAGEMDVDGDYYRDFIIAAPKADNDVLDQSDNGALYLVRGILFQDRDGDGYSHFDGDCLDSDSSIYPDASEIAYDGIDQNCDGSDLTDVDADGYASVLVEGSDCDDSSATIYPGAVETCNEQDDDCDGTADESVQNTYYRDTDSDGYGTQDDFTFACNVPAGYVLNAEDCNDSDPHSYAGATEIAYDGVDQDCNGTDLTDVDKDGQSAGSVGGTDCNDDDPSIYQGAVELEYDNIDQDCDGSDLLDVDGDGFDWDGRGGADCDDNNASINPNASEVAYDGIDQNCDGTDLVDVDGDGYASMVVGGSDCNDRDPSLSPAMVDIAGDGLDQNCSGSDASDEDRDGYAVDDEVDDDTDCDDTDGTIYPGADEIPYDDIDQDCNQSDLIDVDEDGSPGPTLDCNDLDPSIYPAADEQPYDAIDQDCSGTDLTDVDQDGFDGGAAGPDCHDGDPEINPAAEEVPANDVDENCDGVEEDQDGDGVALPEDCDDLDPQRYPQADEVPYDGIDQDCDEADLNDLDGDGFPGGEDASDCDDEDPAIYPGAAEVPQDGLDNDCDGKTDPSDFDQDGFSNEAGDCDDENPNINPAVREISGDGIDNNCNLKIDEQMLFAEEDPGGCSCAQGTKNPSQHRAWSLLFALAGLLGSKKRSLRSARPNSFIVHPKYLNCAHEK